MSIKVITVLQKVGEEMTLSNLPRDCDIPFIRGKIVEWNSRTKLNLTQLSEKTGVSIVTLVDFYGNPTRIPHKKVLRKLWKGALKDYVPFSEDEFLVFCGRKPVTRSKRLKMAELLIMLNEEYSAASVSEGMGFLVNGWGSDEKLLIVQKILENQ